MTRFKILQGLHSKGVKGVNSNFSVDLSNMFCFIKYHSVKKQKNNLTHTNQYYEYTWIYRLNNY